MAAGIVVAVMLVRRDASPIAWFAIFPFTAAAAFCLLEVRERTCVFLGLRGAEEVEGGGVRAVRDAGMRAQARRQAMEVLWKSLAIAAAVTLVAVVAAGVSIAA